MSREQLVAAIQKHAEFMREHAERIEMQEFRDVEELLCVLRRILSGSPTLKAFGAPGDWGYKNLVGRALAQIYEQNPDGFALNAMDSAPRDGREVLLKVRRRAGIPGKFLVGHYMAGGHCIEDHPPISKGWYFWNGCAFDQASEPMGWCNLPDITGV